MGTLRMRKGSREISAMAPAHGRNSLQALTLLQEPEEYRNDIFQEEYNDNATHASCQGMCNAHATIACAGNDNPLESQNEYERTSENDADASTKICSKHSMECSSCPIERPRIHHTEEITTISVPHTGELYGGTTPKTRKNIATNTKVIYNSQCTWEHPNSQIHAGRCDKGQRVSVGGLDGCRQVPTGFDGCGGRPSAGRQVSVNCDRCDEIEDTGVSQNHN